MREIFMGSGRLACVALFSMTAVGCFIPGGGWTMRMGCDCRTPRKPGIYMELVDTHWDENQRCGNCNSCSNESGIAPFSYSPSGQLIATPGVGSNGCLHQPAMTQQPAMVPQPAPVGYAPAPNGYAPAPAMQPVPPAPAMQPVPPPPPPPISEPQAAPGVAAMPRYAPVEMLPQPGVANGGPRFAPTANQPRALPARGRPADVSDDPADFETADELYDQEALELSSYRKRERPRTAPTRRRASPEPMHQPSSGRSSGRQVGASRMFGRPKLVAGDVPGF